MHRSLLYIVPVLTLLAGATQAAEPSKAKANATKADCLQALSHALDICANKPEAEQAACDAAAGKMYRQCLAGTSQPPPPPPPTKEEECLKIEQAADLACAKKPAMLQQECFANAQREFRACMNNAK